MNQNFDPDCVSERLLEVLREEFDVETHPDAPLMLIAPICTQSDVYDHSNFKELLVACVNSSNGSLAAVAHTMIRIVEEQGIRLGFGGPLTLKILEQCAPETATVLNTPKTGAHERQAMAGLDSL